MPPVVRFAKLAPTNPALPAEDFSSMLARLLPLAARTKFQPSQLAVFIDECQFYCDKHTVSWVGRLETDEDASVASSAALLTKIGVDAGPKLESAGVDARVQLWVPKYWNKTIVLTIYEQCRVYVNSTMVSQFSREEVHVLRTH